MKKQSKKLNVLKNIFIGKLMNKEELKQYLKDNLVIDVMFKEGIGEICLSLLIEDEVINTVKINISNNYDDRGLG